MEIDDDLFHVVAHFKEVIRRARLDIVGHLEEKARRDKSRLLRNIEWSMVMPSLHSESEQKPRGIRPFKPLGLFSDARDMENRLLKASKTFTEDTIPPFPLKCGH